MKWEGYPLSENSWVREEDLVECDHLIEAYRAADMEKRKKRGKQTNRKKQGVNEEKEHKEEEKASIK